MKSYESDDNFEDFISKMNLSKLMNTLTSLRLNIKHRREIDKIKRKSRKLGIDVNLETYQGNGHNEIFSELLNILQEYHDQNNKKERFQKNKSRQNFSTILTIKRRDKRYSVQELVIKLWLNRVELVLLQDRQEFSIRLMEGRHRIAIEDVIISSEKNNIESNRGGAKTGHPYYIAKTSDQGYHEIELIGKMTVTFGIGGDRLNRIWSNGKFDIYLEQEEA